MRSSTTASRRSTASRSRCSTRTRRSSCAAACRTACKMYTGDDFNYPELIEGDEQGYSHALLGIFDPLAPAAAYAVSRLAKGDKAEFRAVLDPTVPLARLIFRAPTQYYKTGVVFLAWLNGFQDHFVMLERGAGDAAAALFHRDFQARRWLRSVARPGPCRAAHEVAARALRRLTSDARLQQQSLRPRASTPRRSAIMSMVAVPAGRRSRLSTPARSSVMAGSSSGGARSAPGPCRSAITRARRVSRSSDYAVRRFLSDLWRRRLERSFFPSSSLQSIWPRGSARRS